MTNSNRVACRSGNSLQGRLSAAKAGAFFGAPRYGGKASKRIVPLR
jgi:hypothetical protein